MPSPRPRPPRPSIKGARIEEHPAGDVRFALSRMPARSLMFETIHACVKTKFVSPLRV